METEPQPETQTESTAARQKPVTAKAPAPTQPQTPPVTINPQAFSEIGMTFGEISQKYGAIVDQGWENGGYWFGFEKAPQHHYTFEEFNATGIYSGQKRPLENDRCGNLMTTAGELFCNLTDSADISSIEKSCGIDLEVSEDSDVSDSFLAHFIYQGFEFFIFLDGNTDVIRPDMSVTVKSYQPYQRGNA